MAPHRSVIVFLIAICCLASSLVQAQWVSQRFELVPGWNAVFLNIDASHEDVVSLIGGDTSSPIEEVWRWNPPGTEQYVETPLEPTDQGSEWTRWLRANPDVGLQSLYGDTAYLVRVAESFGSTYSWVLKGKPVLPRASWRVDGLNLIGFSTVPDSPPSFSAFLRNASELDEVTTEIFRYVGGELGASNPQPIVGQLLETIPVRRGEAFWMRNGEVFNRYFGSFEIVNTGSASLKFGQNLGVLSLRLRNLSPDTLTISATLLASEAAPLGQTGIVGTPPLLLRGDIDLTTLTYGYSAMLLNEAKSWTLNGRDQEGSEVEVILGLDRSALAGSAGDFFGGILRFTDSLGFSQIDVGVSAEVAPSSGLWVGSAAITQVGQYLKSYVRDADNHPVADEAGRYQVENVDTTLAGVARTTSLRLIIHNPEAGPALLLQRVYFGTGTNGAVVLSNSERILDRSQLDSARRLSAAHLPWSEANPGWVFDTALQAGSRLTTRVTTLHGDQASNPFLHTYHPDHDNRDPRFASELPRGVESYDIIRDIVLSPSSSEDDFRSRTQAGSLLTGRYQETIQLLGEENDIREFQVEGSFALQRVIESPVMTMVNP